MSHNIFKRAYTIFDVQSERYEWHMCVLGKNDRWDYIYDILWFELKLYMVYFFIKFLLS